MEQDNKHMPLETTSEEVSQTSSQSPGSLLEKTEIGANVSHIVYITGWRKYILSLALGSLHYCICLSDNCQLQNLNVHVPRQYGGTDYWHISDDLHRFDQMGWVVTGYLVTYTSMLIIWSKLSDIFGRKPAAVSAMLTFLVFSGGCGAAQTMTQLIICRVFQGIGAAGCISMTFAIAYEMVPKHEYPAQAALISVAIALGSLVGPLIGGAVSQGTTWRWVFLINVPAGIFTVVLLLICIPTSFPHHGDPSHVAPTWRERFSRPYLARLDFSGAFFLLGATITLVTALLEAGTSFSWSSATSIALLVNSWILWIIFFVNEKIMTSEKRPQEPIFPWRFLHNRVWMGVLLVSFLSGVPYNIIVIDLPQRFQTLNGISPLGAGVRLIPFNLLAAFGSVAVNVVAVKARIAPIFLVLAGSCLEVVGVTLLSHLPEDGTFTSAIYGYQVIAGFGIGCMFGILAVLPPHLVENRDLAISSGALIQFRVLGSVLGLAICSSVMNNRLTSQLINLIGPEALSSLRQSTAATRNFAPSVQNQVLTAFAEGYTLQTRILIGFAGVQVLLVGMLWRKQQISVVGEKRS